MLKFDHVTAAKLHLSDFLGGAVIVGAIYQIWYVVLISSGVWLALFLSKWGNYIWKERPNILLRMLAVPICLSPTVIANYWFSDAVVPAVFLGLVGFTIISLLTSKLNREAVTTEGNLSDREK